LDPDGFIKLQEALLPDWFQAMSDADTDISSRRKRSQKSVARTLTFLDDIQERLRKSDVSSNVSQSRHGISENDLSLLT